MMHLIPFFTPLLLLTGQTTLISAALTPTAIIDALQDASSAASDAISDAKAVTLANAATQYKAIVQDGITLSNALNQDTIDIQGSATLDAAAADSVAEEVSIFTTDLINFFNALVNIVKNFALLPPQKAAVLAAGTALKNGAQPFLDVVASLTTNVDINGGELQQIASVVAAYNTFFGEYDS